ncbi:DNA-binding transcriptional regulator, AcrR family [Nocardioides scoriae]|uniref:DNA-binding transcriptional regulator, AcrR family n=1 Tax=Nocardioides scoriae TaxID=642780 RepID=A0A1H1V6H9_9ACTN|nr:TetR family transcriptional regulator [Nocardioides scoriae]SDS79879.1 DNA-binding transcriptional regulator, AcrR family [Nocardioides scoriae]
MPPSPALRDTARGAVRGEVMRQAWLLFARDGFEATTVEQIAAAAGMSRRTFFRYFAGKEELVLERLLESGEELAAALAARPDDEPAWPALRRAFDQLVEVQEAHAERSRPLQLMLRDEPSLRGVLTERHRRWLELLVPLVEQRLPARSGRRGPDARARALTSCALACLQEAQELWAEHDGARLGPLLDEAMDAVATP